MGDGPGALYMIDRPGPVSLCCGGRGRGSPQHKAGLRDCDRPGACHPRLRVGDHARSPGPVYGGPLAAAALFS